MPTAFPTSLDDFVDPSPSSSQTAIKHSEQHSDVNAAIEAIERKLGINASADPASVDYKLARVRNREGVSISDYSQLVVGNDYSAAFAAAVANGKDVYFPDGDYNIANVSISLANQHVYASGKAKLVVTGAVGVDILSASNSEFYGFSIQGVNESDGKIGIRAANLDNSSIHSNSGRLIQTFILAPAKQRMAWFGGINFVPSFIRNNRAINVGRAIQLENNAEYIQVESNYAFACTDWGIYSEAGNSPLIGNQVIACDKGICVIGNGNGGVLANPDHSIIGFNTVNHCRKVGIYLDGVSVATTLVGNQVWAVDSAQAFLTYGKSFGLFMRSCRRINSYANTFMNSDYNVGYDGLADSRFCDQIDSSAVNLVRYYRCEGIGSFTDNRNTTIDLCNVGGNGNTVVDLIENASAFPHYLFDVKSKPLSPSANLTSLVAADYKLDGRHRLVQANQTYVNTIKVANYLQGMPFEVAITAAEDTGVLIQSPPGTVFISQTPLATVVGTVATLRATSGRFIFTPTPGTASWSVTCVGHLEKDAALVNSWINHNVPVYGNARWKVTGDGILTLEGVCSGGIAATNVFQIPVPFRPAKERFFSACGNGAFSQMRLKADGNVFMDVYPSTWAAFTATINLNP